ncbi:YceI family protein [Arenimonas fontis]|uniref:YceI family protein n=1 Tax=Arenimonas fontis TaxID=2608255 RepID=A0A5B2ZDM5_9GAMM|nr:YceI family protein [Arenimonas fontis]KAA2285182.1 YceI family protein [Arenimonas fontis]
MRLPASLVRSGLLALCLAPGPAPAADYVATGDARLDFSSSYEGEAFEGRFRRFEARIAFDPDAPQSCRFEVRIALASADTGLPERDDMLMEREFFDVGRQPMAYYRADRCRALPDGGFVAEGRLGLRGVERPVPLCFRWIPGESPVLEGEAGVDRLAFGVGTGDWADTDLIPAEVAIRTRVPLRRAGD